MFETSDGNAALIDVMQEVESPTATSLAYEVYKRMPNDTDFTVFRAAGMAGLNFAFVGDVAHYHTPLDDLRHLDARTVQHQGASVWAVTRALANRELSDLHGDDAVYLDVWGLTLLSAPVSAVVPGSIVLLLGVLAMVAVLRRRAGLSWRALGWGMLAALGGIVVTAVAAMLTDRLIVGLAEHPTPWYANPLPQRYALVVALVLVGGAWIVPVGRRAGVVATLVGVTLAWSGLGLAVALSIRGAAPFALLPTMALLASLMLVAFVRPSAGRNVVVLGLPTLVTGALWIPLGLGLEQTLGFAAAIAVVAPWIMSLTAVAPDAVARSEGRSLRWWHGLVGLLAWAAVVVVAARVEPYDEDHPRRLSVAHMTDATAGTAQLLAHPAGEPLPEAIRKVASFGDPIDASTPLIRAAWSAPAEPSERPPPQLEVLEEQQGDGGRRVKIRLQSPRGADRIALLFPSGAAVRGMTVHDQTLAPDDLPAHFDGRQGLVVFGVPPQGVEVQLELGAAAPMQVELYDVSIQLTAAAQALADARPDWAVQSQWGDSAVMKTVIQL
jgi:hypothetical protein